MVGGGLALCLDIRPRLAVVGLVATMIPTTLAGHSFWVEEDPVARKANRPVPQEPRPRRGLVAFAVGEQDE